MSRHTILSLTAILCLMAAVSCTRSETAAPDGGGEIALQASVAQQTARTWLDSSSEGDVLPVYWSNGDRINVNGAASSPLTLAEGEKVASAVFKLKNVEAPYNVVYPASVFKSAGAAGKCNISIPAVQQWKEGSFGEGAAILCSHSEGDGAVALKNVCGAIRIRLSDSEANIVKALSISCQGDEAIAGDFSLDYASGTLTAAASGKIQTVTMTLPEEGVALSPSGTDFYFTIPAGRYAKGFLIRFDDADRHILRSYWLRESIDEGEGLTVQAGKLVSFPMAAYDPDGREILTPEDWQTFATSYNSGTEDWKEWLCKDGSIRLGADINTTDLTPISNLRHELNGCGHTITMTAMTSPLFTNLNGAEAIVSNLTIAGTNTPDNMDIPGASIFAGLIKGGSIINCVNEAQLNIEPREEKAVVAPFARALFHGNIENCTNKAPIWVNINITNSDYPVTVGGIVATIRPTTDQNMAAPAYVKGCTNNGDINVRFIRPGTSNTHRPTNAGYGGIVGSVAAGKDSINCLNIINCENNGDVNVDFNSTISGTSNSATGLVSGTGGILGLAVSLEAKGANFSWWTGRNASTITTETFEDMGGYFVRMKGCTNNGNIYSGLPNQGSSDDPYKVYAGGLIGILNGLNDAHAVIDNCASFGTVSTTEGKFGRAALGCASGGLAGNAGYADFTDCIVKSPQVGNLKWDCYSTSADIGYAHLSFKLIRCKLFADIQLVRAEKYSVDNYSLGFSLSTKENASNGGIRPRMADLGGSLIQDCSFGGSFTLTKAVTYSATPSSEITKINITASNMEDFICSPSFKEDYFYKQNKLPSITALVEIDIDSCTYWDGQL